MKHLASALILASIAAEPAIAGPKSPAVVELFTAQGCASCLSANAIIARLNRDPAVIALTWSVDYWDYLGWRDTFAQPAFSARQKALDRRLGPANVYTPQVVINGVRQYGGDDPDAVDQGLARARRARNKGPIIRFPAAGRVEVGAARAAAAPADVWLVRYDPREQVIKVTDGDNRGTTVTLRNVVRQVVRLGVWRGERRRYPILKAPAAGLAGAVLVEEARGGPILAAARIAPSPR